MSITEFVAMDRLAVRESTSAFPVRPNQATQINHSGDPGN